MDIDEYLSNYFKGKKNVKLKGIKFLTNELSHPEKDLKIIHIAGTNGKGSCAEMMTNILVKAGYKVGKFISPHLIKFNERISINNQNITDKKLEELIKKVDPLVQKYNSKEDVKISMFELMTCLAFLYFKQEKCDIVILESGLGGLYDSTNIVNPLVSIITSVGYDHMHILGNTLEEIAYQKAGIIKENSETIFVKQSEPEVNNLIEKTCKEKNNTLHLINKNEITNYTYDNNFQKIDFKNYKNILINLKGEKQIYNASICLECAEILKNKSFKISEDALREGLKTVIHKARFEEISKNPLVIYDGAHNKPAVDNFINSVNMYYKNDKKVYIISILKTKDYKSMIKELVKDENNIFIFTDGNDRNRYVSKNELLNIAKKYTKNTKIYCEDLELALKLIKEKYSSFVTFVIGSFYIYGTVIKNI